MYEFYTLLLWAEGFSQKEIAAKLFRSTKFVENIFSDIRIKLKTKNVSTHYISPIIYRNLCGNQISRQQPFQLLSGRAELPLCPN